MNIAQKISSKYFHYDKKENLMVAEISDFPKGFNPLGRIYDDAYDIGFTIISTKTGRELTFYLVDKDANGKETFGWRFAVVPECVKGIQDNGLPGCLIIND